jgi:hypothetical protein
VHVAMWNKAQGLIAIDALNEWRKANILPSGKRRKRHRPYSITPRAQQMVAALATADADMVATLIRDWDRLNDPV